MASPSAVPGIGRAQFEKCDWWKDKNDEYIQIHWIQAFDLTSICQFNNYGYCNSMHSTDGAMMATHDNHMPYFRTTRRFAPGGRLGHDSIALADILFICNHVMIIYYKDTVNIGITYRVYGPFMLKLLVTVKIMCKKSFPNVQ